MTADQQLLTDTADEIRELAEAEAALRKNDPYFQPGGEASNWDRLMHPGVGRALAELLRLIEQFDHPDMCPTRFGEDNCNCPKSAALTVARELRGDQP